MKNGLLALCICLGLFGCGSVGQIAQTGLDVTQAAGYSPSQLNNAVKEVLTVSTQRTSEVLGVNGGYSANSLYSIALPSEFSSVVEPMRKLGLGSYLDNIENLMNRGAELAVKEATPIFINAIKNMSVADALGIVRGSNTAATDYFRGQSESAIRARYQTIIAAQLQQLGFYNDYKKIANSISMLPIANKPNLDLESYAVEKGMNALFTQIATEEAKIRANPVAAGSTLISAIFSK